MGCMTAKNTDKKFFQNGVRGEDAELSNYVNRTTLRKNNQRMTTIQQAEESAEQSRMNFDYQGFKFNRSFQQFDISHNLKDFSRKPISSAQAYKGSSDFNNDLEKYAKNTEQNKPYWIHTRQISAQNQQNNHMLNLPKYPTKQQPQQLRVFTHSKPNADVNILTRESETKCNDAQCSYTKEQEQHQWLKKHKSKQSNLVIINPDLINQPGMAYGNFEVRKILCCINDQ